MLIQRKSITKRRIVFIGILLLLLAVEDVAATSKQQKQQQQRNSHNQGKQQHAPNLPKISHSIYNEDIAIATKYEIMQTTSGSKCASSSPVHAIKYGQTTAQEEKEADFCREYSQRTCCTLENFGQLKQQFHKQMYMQIDLSVDCQQVLQQLICYDCDGDIGVGYRKGVCSTQCGYLYQVCQNDYFVVEQKATARIRVCNKNDVVCSQLKDILDASHKADFCRLLGYEVSDRADYDEWFYQFVGETATDLATFQPVCWNFQPSALFLGPALPAQPASTPPPNPKPTDKKASPKAPKFDPNNPLGPFAQLNQKYETILYVLYAIIGLMVLGVVIYCCCQCCSKKEKDDYHYD